MSNIPRVIYLRHRDVTPQIAYLPNEAPPDDKHAKVVWFEHEHEVDGGMINMQTGTFTSKNWVEPDRVHVNMNHSEILKMSVVKTIRVLRDADAAQWQEMELEYQEILRQRAAFLRDAYKRARPLHQRDIDPDWGKE